MNARDACTAAAVRTARRTVLRTVHETVQGTLRVSLALLAAVGLDGHAMAQAQAQAQTPMAAALTPTKPSAANVPMSSQAPAHGSVPWGVLWAACGGGLLAWGLMRLGRPAANTTAALQNDVVLAPTYLGGPQFVPHGGPVGRNPAMGGHDFDIQDAPTWYHDAPAESDVGK